MANLIDGKQISKEIKDELKELVAKKKEEGMEATLAVIQVGNDPASSVYVGNKKKACEYIGIHSLAYELPEETTQDELVELINKLNKDNSVHGILVQLPLPKHMCEDDIIKTDGKYIYRLRYKTRIIIYKDHCTRERRRRIPSSKCRCLKHWTKGICFLYSCWSHPAAKTFRN